KAGIETRYGRDSQRLYQRAITRGVLKWGEGERPFPVPWDLLTRPGDKAARGWNLPEASRNWVAVLPRPPEFPLTRSSPYLGLHWFKESDAELFFGRNRAIWELYRLVTQQPLEPIILVHGQTGVGKSSLLEAGLLPRLKNACEVRLHR